MEDFEDIFYYESMPEERPAVSITTKQRRTKKIRGKCSIDEELVGMNFTPEVKNLACQIFDDLTINTPKLVNRNKAIFYCLYVACKQLDAPFSMYEIGSHLGLTRSQMSTAISEYCSVGNKIKITGYTNPSNTIRAAAKQLGFTEERKDHMIEEWRKFVKCDKSLEESVTSHIVAAFVWLYCSARCPDCKIEQITSIFMLKPCQITTSVSRLITLTNSNCI